MDITTANTSEKPARSYVTNRINQSSCPPADERQYHEVVLQIPPGQTEEDVEVDLIHIAQSIGLGISNDIHPQFDIARFADHFPNSSFRFEFESSPPTSANSRYLNNNSVSSPPTIVSSSNEIASSMYSAASISTRPTSHGSETQAHSPPISSRPRHAHRPSLSSSQNWSGSRERRVRFSNFKLSFGKFPNFRRRSAAAPIQSHSSPVWSETRSITPGADNLQCQSPQSRYENLAPLSDNSPSININNNDNYRNSAMMQSFNCPQLQELRSVQEAQRDRYLAFKERALESLFLRHEESKSLKRREHENIERDIDHQNMQEANRLEELQLNAELDLVEELRRERQTLEMRIRHMEGYLNSPPPHSESWLLNTDNESLSRIQQHHRQITQKDRDHLREKYRERDRIDTLHMSKIKVLRDTQERKYQETISKQEKHANEIAGANESAFNNLVSRCDDETAATSMWFTKREQHLGARWILEEAIVRKRLEIDTGISYLPLPVISFSKEDESRISD
ncbi:hypothetical protein AJ78_00570 [Emergomyces pasteurianus Ep9510]|uniref:Uncharacterized protein n=1 Tax=Emergomyces pasteurianus Ep9510 TaxID=1447872 RepID=A0A1J9QW24_9EURO|nr:hypothetical protein AJ78_00570 [Emergomyces pasteurianus Ep9510]